MNTHESRGTMRFILCCALAVAALGCTKSEDDASNGDTQPASSSIEGFFVKAAPSGAKTLSATKVSAKVGQTVTFQARIGGRATPFVENRAIMVVIDSSLKACDPDEGCAHPWDYCCETQEALTANTATVQFLGDDGKPMKVSLKGNNGLAELEWVTVVGEVAVKDEAGTLVINAKNVFVGKG